MNRITKFAGWLMAIVVFCVVVVATTEIPKMLPQNEVRLAQYEAQQAQEETVNI